MSMGVEIFGGGGN